MPITTVGKHVQANDSKSLNNKDTVQSRSISGVPWSVLNYKLADGSVLALYTIEKILFKDGCIVLKVNQNYKNSTLRWLFLSWQSMNLYCICSQLLWPISVPI